MSTTTALQVFKFHDSDVRITDKSGEHWFVAKDVCDVLGLDNVTKALLTLDDDEKITLNNSEGNPRYGIPNTYNIISESGMYSLVLRSRKPEAKEFKRWITHEVLPTIRKTGSYSFEHIEGLRDEFNELRDENDLLRQKLQIFEEYNDDTLYDFDQAAALVAHYRKPPFGQKHLKDWLERRNVLCNAHYKNDKPIQCYIDRGWFKAVVHEWFRKGRRRYETRYLFTQKGLIGIVDLAIREKMIQLPAPKQDCLPGMYDEPHPIPTPKFASCPIPNKPR